MNRKGLDQSLFFCKTSAFLDGYLIKQCNKSPNTVETYRSSLNCFHIFLKGKGKSIRNFKFSECTRDLLLDYTLYLQEEKKYEANSCNIRIAAIRSYLNYVSDCDSSIAPVALVASRVPLVKVPRRVKDLLSEEHKRALFVAPPMTDIGQRDQCILITLYSTGIRVSELTGLNRNDVSLGLKPYIRVLGKGNKERTIYLSQKNAEHLSAFINRFHKDSFPQTPLFYTKNHGDYQRMGRRNVERIVKKYADKVRPQFMDFPKTVYPHMLRRSRFTDLYRDGVEIELIAELAGHVSTETTRVYAIPSPEQLREVMEKCSDSPESRNEWEEDEEFLAFICGLK